MLPDALPFATSDSWVPAGVEARLTRHKSIASRTELRLLLSRGQVCEIYLSVSITSVKKVFVGICLLAGLNL